ncbi:response regulator transcription factor [Aliarcobacter cibarius]|jgi:DNA-binding response OmpR family regulator|uniref:Response regulator transcription factor n=1 Tax=Aliarcobacter cibarius TaxID=255507 RepID=A0A5J6RKR3_9BACT|nr:response regulator transcription factor [Aliarcobacter cibarius]QEZ89438.1 two-component system response regulator [Aliarcobacter cibarius]QKJ27437.1 two-component system response regulator [Aliarcobacter cibarius]TLS98812.1 response regulator transcription factor [Aliarcobacter cibarius]TLS99607.1 response regulator transcription factor [Aliarcobacter cibarius]TLT04328.1 response regulator transcription factor [Aliarcobacter cibarius]
MIKILLLEDDFLYKESIKEFLEELDFVVDDFDNGEDALNAIFETKYDLLLLDIRVPKIDGFSLVKYVRESNIDTPIIILTSLTDIKDLSHGYTLGCNDYIRKPFDMIELKHRIEQQIKNYFQSNEDCITLQFGYKFNIKKMVLSVDNVIVELSQKELELVAFLVQNRGFFVSIESLHENVWENKEISYADIRMCIKRVREKTNNNFIVTKRFLGYKIEK